MNDAVKTKIRASGLRYQSKSTGTEFPGPFAGTMSCFVCGKHVPRSKLVSFKLAGSHHLRCKDGC
jgi:hypothetical protein